MTSSSKAKLWALAAMIAVAGVTVPLVVGHQQAVIDRSSLRPGSAAQVAAIVASASQTTRLPSDLFPSLADVPSDNVYNSYLHPVGGDCLDFEPRCTFGVKSSKKIVVLFGDSHAWMWLTAIVPTMVKQGYRLQLLWMSACPIATIPVWYVKFKRSDPECVKWRAQAIKMIHIESPHLVLLSERTAELYADATTLITDQQIETGLEETIVQLKGPTTKVALIGDIPVFANRASPAVCLSLHPSSIQRCDTPLINPDPKWTTHALAERRAAAASDVVAIDPAPWFCHGGRCFPVVGRFATYWDWSHVSATYGSYLSGVMGAWLSPLL